jgi:hypothetical protein
MCENKNSVSPAHPSAIRAASSAPASADAPPPAPPAPACSAAARPRYAASAAAHSSGDAPACRAPRQATRRVRLVRGEGRGVSTLYEGGGRPRQAAFSHHAAPRGIFSPLASSRSGEALRRAARGPAGRAAGRRGGGVAGRRGGGAAGWGAGRRVTCRGTEGNSQSPARSPSGGRWTSRKRGSDAAAPSRFTAPAQESTQTATRSSRAAAFFALAGKRVTGSAGSARCAASARQSPASGQAPHTGDVGVHTVAPSSIRPWLRSPGRACVSTSARASAQCALTALAALGSPASARSRERTRTTLPSTSGARRPKAMDETAPAVYSPMPARPRPRAQPPAPRVGRRRPASLCGAAGAGRGTWDALEPLGRLREPRAVVLDQRFGP